MARLAWVIVGSLAAAGARAADEIAEMTVTAMRMTKEVVAAETVGRSPTTGAPIQRVKLERSVPFADLDLRTDRGSTELIRRVNATAKAACQELDGLYPLSPPGGGEDCARDAVAGAMAQAQRLISAAGKMRAAPIPK